MNLITHPLFALGFRPFFTGAIITGLAMIPLWTLSFAGLIDPPPAGVAIVLWHAHEMIYGFVAAVIAGCSVDGQSKLDRPAGESTACRWPGCSHCGSWPGSSHSCRQAGCSPTQSWI